MIFSRAMIRACIFGAAFCCALTQTHAGCYHRQGDGSETIRDGEDGLRLVWERKGKRVEFETGSAGTGIGSRVAYDPKLNGFRYEYVGKNLVFGGVTYVPGCK
jgi:hypothetical protein